MPPGFRTMPVARATAAGAARGARANGERGEQVRLNVLDWIAYILVIIGALNWGLVGLFNFNLVTFLFGSVPVLVAIIYILVGLAGLYLIYLLASRTAEVRA